MCGVSCSCRDGIKGDLLPAPVSCHRVAYSRYYKHTRTCCTCLPDVEWAADGPMLMWKFVMLLQGDKACGIVPAQYRFSLFATGFDSVLPTNRLRTSVGHRANLILSA